MRLENFRVICKNDILFTSSQEKIMSESVFFKIDSASIVTTKLNTSIDPSEFELHFKTRYGTEIRYYDDGFGELWIFQNSMGIVGIVRCQSESDAIDIVYDEFYQPISDKEELKEIETYALAHDGELEEGYTYQSNATGSGIVAIDLNGELIHRLTHQIIKNFGIAIQVCFKNS